MKMYKYCRISTYMYILYVPKYVQEFGIMWVINTELLSRNLCQCVSQPFTEEK